MPTCSNTAPASLAASCSAPVTASMLLRSDDAERCGALLYSIWPPGSKPIVDPSSRRKHGTPFVVHDSAQPCRAARGRNQPSVGGGACSCPSGADGGGTGGI